MLLARDNRKQASGEPAAAATTVSKRVEKSKQNRSAQMRIRGRARQKAHIVRDAVPDADADASMLCPPGRCVSSEGPLSPTIDPHWVPLHCYLPGILFPKGDVISMATPRRCVLAWWFVPSPVSQARLLTTSSYLRSCIANSRCRIGLPQPHLLGSLC